MIHDEVPQLGTYCRNVCGGPDEGCFCVTDYVLLPMETIEVPLRNMGGTLR